MSHTKGNWRYSEEYMLVTTSEKGIIEGSKTICDLKEKPEVKYNGKLIAAAPDLLEALESIVKYWNETQSSGLSLHDHINHSLEIAQKAIKKAAL